MPTFKKYFLSSNWVRASKFVASILGGVVTILFHVIAALMGYADYVMLSVWYTFPIIWVTIITLIYWNKSAWKVWAVLVSVSALCSSIIYVLKTSS